jgi:hypothetical protein
MLDRQALISKAQTNSSVPLHEQITIPLLPVPFALRNHILHCLHVGEICLEPATNNYKF